MTDVPTQTFTPQNRTYYSTIITLVFIFLAYIVLLLLGLPQKWTNAQSALHEGEIILEIEDAENVTQPVSASSTIEEDAEAEEVQTAPAFPPFWTSIPFALLLLCIAILPLIPKVSRWWESNLNRFIVAAILGGITLAYYAFLCDFPIDLHWPAHKVVAPSEGAFAMASTVFSNAILGEYVSFIVLLFALFSITGGIRIVGDLRPTPFVNSCILAVGAIMASFVGTTGAAMLLIRLLLDTNKIRCHKKHTVIFFIFCVCNVGGCLLPIGDPPLFLGYLRGVAFLWTLQLWKQWLFISGILIASYFIIDSLFVYPRELPLTHVVDKIKRCSWKLDGFFLNFLCLLGVILAVMLLDPGQEFLSLFHVKTGWYPPMFLREIVQLLMVACSFIFGSNAVRKENDFNFGAIVEVAVLFFGIFICMQAPLQILNAKGAQLAEALHQYGNRLGVTQEAVREKFGDDDRFQFVSKFGLNQAQEFFWCSGTLSSVLDNAPTYVVFFETARAASEGRLKELRELGLKEDALKLENDLQLGEAETGVRIPITLLIAVSLGSVFMGAMTYIGNGPNFMVKAIAEQNGVKMPSFFGYMVYSLGIFLPIVFLTTIIFL